MENKKKRQTILAVSLIGSLLVIDQAVKIWVKTHMQIGEDIPLIGDWCILHFVENEGFAFGMSIGGTLGKIILSLFRLVASAIMAWVIVWLIRKGHRTAMIAYASLILAGAVGNLIDCTFYGVIFNDSYYSVAQMFPPEGYAPLLQGRVVDMFYFPLIDTTLPSWIPIWGGEHFVFFNAIFNVADSAITIGSIWLVLDVLFSKKAAKKNALKGVENGENAIK